MFPVGCVDWVDAVHACAYEGKRLPTQTEGEVAAEGARRAPRPLPLGPPMAESAALRHLVTAGLHITCGDVDDLSAYLVCDMAGNVAEWTSSVYNGGHIVRGGSYLSPTPLFSAARVAVLAAPDIGFRCVLDPAKAANATTPR